MIDGTRVSGNCSNKTNSSRLQSAAESACAMLRLDTMLPHCLEPSQPVNPDAHDRSIPRTLSCLN